SLFKKSHENRRFLKVSDFGNAQRKPSGNGYGISTSIRRRQDFLVTLYMSGIFGWPRSKTRPSKLATDLNREVPAALLRKRRNWACCFDVVFMSFHVDDDRRFETENQPQLPRHLKLTAGRLGIALG